MGIIWGSKWAYFGKRGLILRGFGRGESDGFLGFVWLEKGELEADFYDGEWNPWERGEVFRKRDTTP